MLTNGQAGGLAQPQRAPARQASLNRRRISPSGSPNSAGKAGGGCRKPAGPAGRGASHARSGGSHQDVQSAFEEKRAQEAEGPWVRSQRCRCRQSFPAPASPLPSTSRAKKLETGPHSWGRPKRRIMAGTRWERDSGSPASSRSRSCGGGAGAGVGGVCVRVGVGDTVLVRTNPAPQRTGAARGAGPARGRARVKQGRAWRCAQGWLACNDGARRPACSAAAGGAPSPAPAPHPAPC